MTSLKLLNTKRTTFCWASVTTNCARLFKSRKDAEEFDYDCINSSVFVVAAHNSVKLQLSGEDCAYCDDPIVAWCVARYVNVHFPDQQDYDYADQCYTGDEPATTGRPWHDGSSGGCYVKDEQLEHGFNSDMLICDILLYQTEKEAKEKEAEINADNTQFYLALVLPCHNEDE